VKHASSPNEARKGGEKCWPRKSLAKKCDQFTKCFLRIEEKSTPPTKKRPVWVEGAMQPPPRHVKKGKAGAIRRQEKESEKETSSPH